MPWWAGAARELLRDGVARYDGKSMPMDTGFRSEEIFGEAEFWQWLAERPPSDVNRYELLEGRIVVSPPARPRHGVSDVRLITAFETFVRARDLGRVFDGTVGYRLPTGDILQPDLSFISWERLGKAPVRTTPEQAMLVVPDLIVEVLSPSTRRRDLGPKRAVYERSGVREYWAVDPDARSVAVFAARDTGFARVPLVVEGSVGSTILPGLAVPIAELFDFAGVDDD